MMTLRVITKTKYVWVILLLIHFGSYLLFKTEVVVTYPILLIIAVVVRLLSAFSLGATAAGSFCFPQISVFFRMALIVLSVIIAVPGVLFIIRYLFLIQVPLIATLKTSTVLSCFSGFFISLTVFGIRREHEGCD